MADPRPVTVLQRKKSYHPIVVPIALAMMARAELSLMIQFAQACWLPCRMCGTARYCAVSHLLL